MAIVQNNSGQANAKQLDYTGKLKTASGKRRINMVTWSFRPFAVKVILNLSIVDECGNVHILFTKLETTRSPKSGTVGSAFQTITHVDRWTRTLFSDLSCNTINIIYLWNINA